MLYHGSHSCIAHFLNVSVEYLVSGGKTVGFSTGSEYSDDLKKFFFYRRLVNKIDSLPKKTKDALVEMFEKI